ncbi:MAG: hypothetical protein KatS3mg077_0116 [Candidatus Binatia bacterium]|nr:MAG: hypothetical protein KatS3mg077_0116 [Candidatus Binatia bacterium]
MGGSDKAFLRINGRPIIERTIGVLGKIFDDVVVVTHSPERYGAFAGVRITSDIFPGQGPLAGLHAGLHHARHSHCFVVACDMPFLRSEPILHLSSLIEDYDAVVPRWDGDVEPLHAFYARRLVPVAERLLVDGKSALRDLLQLVRVRYVSEMELTKIPGAEETFRNVNTPADAARYSLDLR